MFVLSLLPIIKLLIMEIYFTVLIISLIVFWVGWFLSNMDKKREDLWFKVSMTSGIVMFLMVVGIVLFSIWF
jgi:4-hydroxybenzoate polyprenyltransferase